MQANAQSLPAGFEFVRLLSERTNSTVTLARAKEGGLVAIKLLRLASGIAPGEALARHRRLQKLTHHEGLLPILDCGLTADGEWLWESLPLADNLDDCRSHRTEDQESADNAVRAPTNFAFRDLSDYTPATLRLRVIERGPLGAEATARVDVSLCEALGRLHEAGLVHRDIKPGKVLIVGGEAKLDDYGLVSEPGQPFDFHGTEGFQPVEGGADQAFDLFALGKALYEVWTGCDRLEFPSLPKRVLESADWNPCGQRLNAVLLRACHRQASARFTSAGEFRGELLRAVDGAPSGLNRRRWLVGTLAGSAAASLGRVSNEARRQKRSNPQGQGSFVRWLRRSLVTYRRDTRPRSLLAIGQNASWQSVFYPTV